MIFDPPLVPGRLLRRYMRFLSDVRLEDGREVRAHCPNPGAMTGLKAPGLRVWLQPNDDPKKKLDWAWRLAELPDGHRACVDTTLPNRVVGEALAAGAIAELGEVSGHRAEVPYGREKSRIDFRLDTAAGPVWMDVKGVSLRREGSLAEFPGSVTARGAKHLRELAALAQAGERAVLFYLVQRTDCARLGVAADIDPTYAAAMAAARAAGVRVIAYDSVIDPQGIGLGRPLPVT